MATEASGHSSRPLTVEDLETAKAAILQELQLLGKLAAERLRAHLMQAAQLRDGNQKNRIPAGHTAAWPPSQVCSPSRPSEETSVGSRDAQFGSGGMGEPIFMDSAAMEALFYQHLARDGQLPSHWEQELERRLQAHTPTPAATPFHNTGAFATPASSCPTSPLTHQFLQLYSRLGYAAAGPFVRAGHATVPPPGSSAPSPIAPKRRLAHSARTSNGGSGASDGRPSSGPPPAACSPVRSDQGAHGSATIVDGRTQSRPALRAPPGIVGQRLLVLPDVATPPAAPSVADGAALPCGRGRVTEVARPLAPGGSLAALGASAWDDAGSASVGEGVSPAGLSRRASEAGRATATAAAAATATLTWPGLLPAAGVGCNAAARRSVDSEQSTGSRSSSGGSNPDSVQRRELPAQVVREIVRQLVQSAPGGSAGGSSRGGSRGGGARGGGAATVSMYDSHAVYFHRPRGPAGPAAAASPDAAAAVAAPAPAAVADDPNSLGPALSLASQLGGCDGSSLGAAAADAEVTRGPYLQLQVPPWGREPLGAPGHWQTTSGSQTALGIAPAAPAAAMAATVTAAPALAAAAEGPCTVASTGPSSCAASPGLGPGSPSDSVTASSQLALSYASTPGFCRTTSSGVETNSAASSPLLPKGGSGADSSSSNSLPLPGGMDSQGIRGWIGTAC